MFAPAHLANWSGPQIDAECGAPHRLYRARRTSSYQAYFGANVEFKDEHHTYKAKDLAPHPQQCHAPDSRNFLACNGASRADAGREPAAEAERPGTEGFRDGVQRTCHTPPAGDLAQP